MLLNLLMSTQCRTPTQTSIPMHSNGGNSNGEGSSIVMVIFWMITMIMIVYEYIVNRASLHCFLENR